VKAYDPEDPVVQHWEKRLAAEGLKPEPPKRLKRGPKDHEGVRPWLGSWEFPTELGQGHKEGMLDVAALRHTYRAYSERPRTFYEALLVEPGKPIDSSVEELVELRDLLLDKMEEHLSQVETVVMLAHVVSGLSLGDVGEILGLAKSTMHQAKERALAKMKLVLKDQPEIELYLARHEVDDE
jgi:hypothetical protein